MKRTYDQILREAEKFEIKSNTSYEKVAKLLFQTPDWNELEKRIKEAFANAKVDGWEFHINHNESGPDTIRVMFKLNFGYELNFVNKYLTGISYRDPYVFRSLFSKKSFFSIVDKNFGQGIPTYNCSVLKLKHGFTKQAMDRIETHFISNYYAAMERLAAECAVKITTLEFKQEEKQFLNQHHSTQIRNSLRKYFGKVDNSVFRDVFKELMMEEIMDV